MSRLPKQLLFAFACVIVALNGLRHDQQSELFGGVPAVNMATTAGQITIQNREQYPYVVEIEYFDEHWCGGALISDNAVLTAAHCLEDAEAEYFKVRVGGTYLKDTGALSDDVQWSRIKQFLIHPKHREGATSNNDIAIVWTTDHFRLNPLVGIINLVEPEKNLEDLTAIVLGWGVTEKGTLSNILLKSTTIVFNHNRCRKIFGSDENGEMVTDNMICAADGKKLVATCTSDSGGPLVLHNPINPALDQLIGLVSFSANNENGGCESKHPSVFTKVSAYWQWVRNNLESETKSATY